MTQPQTKEVAVLQNLWMSPFLVCDLVQLLLMHLYMVRAGLGGKDQYPVESLL